MDKRNYYKENFTLMIKKIFIFLLLLSLSSNLHADIVKQIIINGNREEVLKQLVELSIDCSNRRYNNKEQILNILNNL